MVVKSLRKDEPLWAYSIGFPEVTRLLMFASLKLGPLVPVKGDVLMVTDKRLAASVDKSIVSELHRRKKLVVGGPVSNPAQLKRWQDLKVDGILTDAPSLIRGL